MGRRVVGGGIHLGNDHAVVLGQLPVNAKQPQEAGNKKMAIVSVCVGEGGKGEGKGTLVASSSHLGARVLQWPHHGA